MKPAALPPQPLTAEVASISELKKERTYTIPLCTMEYDPDRGWVGQPARGSPRLPVELSLCEEAYIQLDRPEPSSQVHGRPIKRTVRRAVADTGAQLNIVDVETIHSMGEDVSSLIPSNTVVKTAEAGGRLDIVGVIFLQVAAPGPPQVRAKVPQQFHVARNANNVYLSFKCLQDLGVVSTGFPRAGEVWIKSAEAAGLSAEEERCSYQGVGECQCPPRELPPDTPAELPCEPIEANIPVLEEYIRRRY